VVAESNCQKGGADLLVRPDARQGVSTFSEIYFGNEFSAH
jgi:hypothetical protein